jgi:hypothetical protein
MADAKTFDLAPRVLDKNGVQYRWTAPQCPDTLFQKIASTLVRPDYDTSSALDLAAAQALLNGALVLTPDMMTKDKPIPDLSNRLLIAPNMAPQSVLAWLSLTTPPEGL